MSNTPSKPIINISTITLSTQLPFCELNLTNIGKYLDIDDDIAGLKYNYADLSVIKGKYLTTVYKKSKIKNDDKINKTLFYNQISIIINNINVKLFGNGSLHLTGCKNINDGVKITKKIYEKLMTLINVKDTILLTKDMNGVLLDKDNLIYSYNNKQIIGHKKNEKLYIINKKEYVIDHHTNMFISNKLETQRRKFIYNFDGVKIGQSKIELLKNKNKFYKKNININFDYNNNLIYHNNDLIIGKITYDFDDNLVTKPDMIQDILEIEYSCNPFINKDYYINTNDDSFIDKIDLNVNCINVYFNINFTINRQRFYEKLIKSNYICKYKPESYSGIKLLYKIPLSGNKNGLCICNKKCTCLNITFLIFQSGNVIATGFKTIEQIDIITSEFLDICNDFKDIIQKKTISTF